MPDGRSLKFWTPVILHIWMTMKVCIWKSSIRWFWSYFRFQNGRKISLSNNNLYLSCIKCTFLRLQNRTSIKLKWKFSTLIKAGCLAIFYWVWSSKHASRQKFVRIKLYILSDLVSFINFPIVRNLIIMSFEKIKWFLNFSCILRFFGQLIFRTHPIHQKMAKVINFQSNLTEVPIFNTVKCAWTQLLLKPFWPIFWKVLAWLMPHEPIRKTMFIGLEHY